MNVMLDDIRNLDLKRIPQRCFFCQHTDSLVNSRSNFDGTQYDCPVCGVYSITRSAKITMENRIKDIKIYDKLASVAAERRLKKLGTFTVGTEDSESSISYETMLKDYPVDFLDKFQRSLFNIGYLTNNSPLEPKNIPPEQCYCTFSHDKYECYEMLKLLKAEGYVDFETTSNDLENGIPCVRLTIDGVRYIQKLKKEGKDGSQAFVAMWFNKEHTQVFRECVSIAIELAGYRCIIIDKYEHNNFIMDAVLNCITEAKFVIADFTCIAESINENNHCVKYGVRGGVYFEAGYAKGLGKEVICTCRDDEESKVRRHFDIEQLNTIFWKQDLQNIDNQKTLIERLYNRIIKTVGPGPIPISNEKFNKYNDYLSIYQITK